MSGVAWNVGVPGSDPCRTRRHEARQDADPGGQAELSDL